MQYSIAKLLLSTTAIAIGFGVYRRADVVGPLCLPIGITILFTAGIAYPVAILSSPQKDTHLDLASNAALPYIHMLVGIGLIFIVVFCIYVASDPFGYLYL